MQQSLMDHFLMRHCKVRAGFTLIEALAVIGIMSLLAAMLMAVFSRTQGKGRSAACQSNIRQINLAFQQYLSDNDGVYMSAQNWQEATFPYVKNSRVYECPSEPTSANSTKTGANVDYIINVEYLNIHQSKKWLGITEAVHTSLDTSKLMTVGDSIVSIPDNQLTIVTNKCGDYIPSTRHFGGANWGFADGHVKWLTPQEHADIYCSLSLLSNLSKYLTMDTPPK